MSLSVIIPIHNEVENLPLLHRALHDALDGLTIPWEVILVDDGSTDGSTAVLQQLAVDDPDHICTVVFRRNFGQTAAMAAGVDHAAGDIIVFMDGDLQNDPADIPMLLEKLAEGHDVVCGWRQKRQDTFVTRKLPSQLANRLIGKVTGVRLHDYGCSLKAFRREVITGFRLYGEMHRFIPAYANMVGARILEVPVRHHARRFGKTKYGLGRTFRVMLDLITVNFYAKFATKPMYLFGGVGLRLFACSALAILAGLGHWIWRHDAGLPLLLGGCAVLGVVAGLLCLLMGLLAEMLMRTYYESHHKPAYHLREVRTDTEVRHAAAAPIS